MFVKFPPFLPNTLRESPTGSKTADAPSFRTASYAPLRPGRRTQCDQRPSKAGRAGCVRLLTSGFAPIALIAATPAASQSVPTIDTEDVTLGSSSVGTGSIHPAFGVDVRNGDFARGNYDDDAADLDRLPVHVQVGVAADLHYDAAGQADVWLVIRSSNGIHSALSDERTSPRGWYESNNLVGLVVAPAAGLRAGIVYTIKASPNGVSDTTHEASMTTSYDGKDAIGWLHPNFAATVRPKGTHGLFTQLGVAPEIALGTSEYAPTLSLPAVIGIGWGGFYDAGSGDQLYGNAGLAIGQPVRLGNLHASLRAEMLALFRDDRLRRLSGPLGETGAVVPLATLSLNITL
jgi:hypothetical protein